MERMGSLDAVFLSIESSTWPMNIGSVGIFEGPAPSPESVQSFVDAKLHLVPRCRQRARRVLGDAARPVWIDDVNFDLVNHLHRASLSGERPRSLEQFVEQVMVQPLDRGRPLWEMWVVEGLEDDRWAIVSKVHHCLVDGIAGTDLLAVMMDSAPGAEPPPRRPWEPAPEPSFTELARFSLAAAFESAVARARGLVLMMRHLCGTWVRVRNVLTGARGLWVQPSRRHSPLTGPIGPGRRWSHASIPLGDVAVVRHAFGGTVNDVVLAAVARGFRELLGARGEALEGRTVMALVPVSTRGTDERGVLDNRVAVIHALLPIGIDDPVATYVATCRMMDDVKASHETDASTVLLHTGDFTPHAIAKFVARAVVRVQQNIETIATNVPGPQHPLYLCGRRMREAYPFAPIAGRIRIAVAIWSYCGILYIGVTGDRESASDLDTFVLGVENGFSSLLGGAAAASEVPTAGRIEHRTRL